MLMRILGRALRGEPLPATAPAAEEQAVFAAEETPLASLRRLVAMQMGPSWTVAELCAHPLRRQGAERMAAGEAAAAEALLRRCLAEAPDSAIDHILLAEVLYQRGDYAGSQQAVHAAAADPGRIGARAAALLAEQAFFAGDCAAARTLLARALAVAPHAASCHILLGNLSDVAGARDPRHYADALAHFSRACALRPDVPLARIHRALALLRLGRLREGFTEWVNAEYLGGTFVNLAACPVWDGRGLGEARILILTHSGFGDVIQFLRFAAHLREREPRARISILLRPPLKALAESTGLFEAVYGDGVGGEHFDWQVSFIHLPALLGVEEPDLCAIEPYLRASPGRAAAAQTWLPPRSPGRPRIGLRWTGFPGQTDALRSTTLAQLRPLLEVPGIDWVSLADGGTPSGSGLIDVSGHLTDFEATAALMGELDLVISVDTSVAHLAGALDRPTWLLARLNTDWRWGRAGDATPWYGSVRVFRHPPERLDWQGMAQEAAAALRAWIRDRPA